MAAIRLQHLEQGFSPPLMKYYTWCAEALEGYKVKTIDSFQNHASFWLPFWMGLTLKCRIIVVFLCVMEKDTGLLILMEKRSKWHFISFQMPVGRTLGLNGSTRDMLGCRYVTVMFWCRTTTFCVNRTLFIKLIHTSSFGVWVVFEVISGKNFRLGKWTRICFLHFNLTDYCDF